MKILYLKSYEWLLPQNQRKEKDFFVYRFYEALLFDMLVLICLAYQSFFKKNIKVKGRQCSDYS